MTDPKKPSRLAFVQSYQNRSKEMILTVPPENADEFSIRIRTAFGFAAEQLGSQNNPNSIATIEEFVRIVHLPIHERPAAYAKLEAAYDDFAGKTYEELPPSRKAFVDNIAAFAKSICIQCKKEGKMMRCNRCKIERYCSRECQVKHWPAHKLKCKEPV